MKTISIVTPCYNEQDNVLNLYTQVRDVMANIGKYEYEHIFIDNSSRDNTVAILKQIAAQDPVVKVIVNPRNFGHIRSPIHALFQARGDAVLGIVADLQDPPPMIADMIREWENGAYCVLGIKRTSEEASLMFWARKQYYRIAERLSSIETIQNYTGFGLYDRKVVDLVRSFDDPYPYFRGMIAEIGLPTVKLLYDQPARKFGITKNNWYTLYDIGMLGIINHSKVPLRLATFAGFGGAIIAFLIAFAYLVLKLIFWSSFELGLAPMLIGVFFIASLQLVFLGVMGEYVGAIYTQVQKRPYAVELERINFDKGFGHPKTGPVLLPDNSFGVPPPGDLPPPPSTNSPASGDSKPMKDLVRKQLQQSIDTMQQVLANDAIHEAVVQAGQITAEAMKNGKKLLVCGNGGSAADAQHLVAEFVSRLTVDRPALRALALTTDTSILTAIGNDYDYANVFERQVEALAIPGDVLLAISTSGNSKNCVKALALARKMGVHTIAYTGNDGGAMKPLADINVVIPSPTTMNIQESHLALEHIFCMVVERFYFGPDFGSKPQQLAE